MYLENHRPRRISLARYKRNYGHGSISWEEKSSVLRGQGWTKTYFLFIVLYFWMLTSWHLHIPKKKNVEITSYYEENQKTILFINLMAQVRQCSALQHLVVLSSEVKLSQEIHKWWVKNWILKITD